MKILNVQNQNELDTIVTQSERSPEIRYNDWVSGLSCGCKDFYLNPSISDSRNEIPAWYRKPGSSPPSRIEDAKVTTYSSGWSRKLDFSLNSVCGKSYGLHSVQGMSSKLLYSLCLCIYKPIVYKKGQIESLLKSIEHLLGQKWNNSGGTYIIKVYGTTTGLWGVAEDVLTEKNSMSNILT